MIPCSAEGISVQTKYMTREKRNYIFVGLAIIIFFILYRLFLPFFMRYLP